MSDASPPRAPRGRGARYNPANRFGDRSMEAVDDGWARGEEEDAPPRLPTEAFAERSRTIVSTNRSPDIPFEQSVNPYRGCEHGCVYCFARPTHEYLDLSLGQDFESKLFYKTNAVELLERFLARDGYRCKPIALGINTDAYQPLEKEQQLTRRLLQTLLRHRHPVSLVTKGSLILRDLDILSEMARDGLVSVMVSITTLDRDLKRIMEPRAPSPEARLGAVRGLAGAGVPVGVLMAPVIPFINDGELEAVVDAAVEHGAGDAGYVTLRLPHQIKDLFDDWLEAHFPLRRKKVLNILRELHGGRLYDARFGARMTGQGVYAELIRRRFDLVRRRHGLDGRHRWSLRSDLFRVPGRPAQQALDV